jgi:hypothetical protein
MAFSTPQYDLSYDETTNRWGDCIAVGFAPQTIIGASHWLGDFTADVLASLAVGFDPQTIGRLRRVAFYRSLPATPPHFPLPTPHSPLPTSYSLLPTSIKHIT